MAEAPAAEVPATAEPDKANSSTPQQAEVPATAEPDKANSSTPQQVEAVPQQTRGGVSPSLATRLAPWAPEDPVDVYYAEFLLAQWILDRSPWNAYHSALAFSNNRTGERALWDFAPDDTSSVMNMVVPAVEMPSQWRGLFGEVNFTFRDAAHTQFYNYWPENYKSYTHLGRLNGSVFSTFARWAAEEYSPRYHAFQPVEVAAVQQHHGAASNGSSMQSQSTVLRSRMCHDFVTDGLWALYREGVAMKADDPIFRDHIILYSEAVSNAGSIQSDRRLRRRWLRYLRLINLFMEEIKDKFTFARSALAANWRLGLPVFLHEEYMDHEIVLTPPFLNYCYLPLAIPPEVHEPMSSMKLCALGMEANMTNITTPFPWGMLLSVEEALDQPQVLPAVLLVALAALLPTLASTRHRAEKEKSQ